MKHGGSSIMLCDYFFSNKAQASKKADEIMNSFEQVCYQQKPSSVFLKAKDEEGFFFSAS